MEMIIIRIFVAFFLLCASVQAKHNSEHPLSADDWKEVMDKVVLLEDSGFMPTLLPVIMRNRDALALTNEQVNAFSIWRKNNYTNMINIMNEIIEKMVHFRVKSLSPGVTKEYLLTYQSEIHDLQRQLLQIKVSCRELVITTFTEEQWENFAFVVADIPKLASLISWENNTNSEHKH